MRVISNIFPFSIQSIMNIINVIEEFDQVYVIEYKCTKVFSSLFFKVVLLNRQFAHKIP